MQVLEQQRNSEPLNSRRVRSIPTSTAANLRQSNPDLNAAQLINPSDLSESSSASSNERNYFTVPASPTTRVIDIQIPLEEKLDGISGLSLVGGADTPLKEWTF